MKKAHHIVLLALLLSIILIGCGKKEKHLFVTTEATETETTASAAAERETLSELPYRPGQMGVYVMAAPDIEADSEVLDNVNFDATDGVMELTRYRVSNRQHDLIKNGMQVGGFILIDIPKEMLNDATENFDGFKALADYVGKRFFQTFIRAKPSLAGAVIPQAATITALW